ncbi:hypothetical protein G7046_g6515 [Stylonectria norvegica]|nr:hypothetical protein G7046_g6515 [Stylonectria norvegica]
MDPMDYILHHHPPPHPRHPSYYDPVHAAASPWMGQPQTSAAYPWQQAQAMHSHSHSHSHIPPVYPTYNAPRPPIRGSDTYQTVPNGGLPPPIASFHSLPGPEMYSSGQPSRYYPSMARIFAQAPAPPPPPPPQAPIPTGNHTGNHTGDRTGNHTETHNHAGHTGHTGPNDIGHGSDDAFGNQLPNLPGRPSNFQQLPAVSPDNSNNGMGMAGMAPPPSAPISLSRSPFSMSDAQQQANAFQHQHDNSHFNIPPPQPPPQPQHQHQHQHQHSFNNSTPPRHSHYVPSYSPSNHRAFRGEVPSPTRPSPPASGPRRSHPRSRRSMSSRVMATEISRASEEDDINRQLFYDQIMSNHLHMDPSFDQEPPDQAAMLRQIQLARGSIPIQMVASRKTLQSLIPVSIEDLSETDKTCVICYNDYGAETPEGNREAPVRLPKCRHVFGNCCIKTWLEDSDSCPYCRDKLHSEPKQLTARVFVNMMRLRGHPYSNSTVGLSPEEVLLRAATAVSPDAHSRQPQSSERRSPPDDTGQQQRRTRPRHNDQPAHDLESPTLDDDPPVQNDTSPATAELERTAREALPAITASSQRVIMPPRPGLETRSSETTPQERRRTMRPHSLNMMAPNFQPAIRQLSQAMADTRNIAEGVRRPASVTSRSVQVSLPGSPLRNPLQTPSGITFGEMPRDENTVPGVNPPPMPSIFDDADSGITGVTEMSASDRWAMH